MRSTIIWLLAFVIPFQVLTAVYLNVVGPLHFHVAIDEDHHDRDHAHAHAHSHGEGHAERHHHAPNEPGMVTVRDGVLDPLAVESEIKSGWSATMLAALVTSIAAFALLKVASRVTPGSEPLLQFPFLGRLERPPRTYPV